MCLNPRYHRILLKLSGEVLAGEAAYGIDALILNRIAGEIKDVCDLGVEVGIVEAGGEACRRHRLGVEVGEEVVGDPAAVVAGAYALLWAGLVVYVGFALKRLPVRGVAHG